MKYRVAATGIVTNSGRVLLGKKEELEDHPVSEKWHFPGGIAEEGEEPEEAVKREIKEETGLEVEVHHLVDATTQTFDDEFEDIIRLIFHCEADSRDAKARDDLQDAKWIAPGKIKEEISGLEKRLIENRAKVENLLGKLEKMPSI